MRGDGYYIRNGVIYVDGELEGKRYRKSTGLTVSKKNIAYVQKNAHVILQNIVQDSQVEITFSNFAMQVIENGSHNRSEDTQKEILSKFKREIEPYFKNYEFDEIKPIHIENWQNNLLKRYSATTVKKYTNILKTIFQKALGNDLCVKDPFVSVDKIRNESQRKKEVYTQDEMFSLLHHSSGWFRTFLVTAFGTGMRTGELLALKWSDIDFNKNKITVQRSIRHAKIKSTKTNRSRNIDMLDMVNQSLSFLYANKKSDEWVFPNKDGNPFSESKNVLKYYFKPLLEKLSINYKTLYVSRHSFISLMLNKGMDLMWVQNMAGHASSTTTLKWYALYIEGDETRINKANNIFSNDKNNGTLVAQKAAL